MIDVKDIKPGCWLISESGQWDTYILDQKGDKFYRLFDDGSGSWQPINNIKKFTPFIKISSKGFSPKKALKKRFDMGMLDNLTYIEKLAKINSNELPR
jgi:hypothetical protein